MSQQTITQTLYILQNICPRSWEGAYQISTHDLSESDCFSGRYACLGTHEVEVPIPADANPAALAIASLEKHRDLVRQEMMMKISAIDERIESIRCIEHKPEDA